MCGRARCALSREDVASTSGVPEARWQDADKYQPGQNMSPGHWSPVVKLDQDGHHQLHTMKWGLVPSFTKEGEKPDHFRMFNARCETVPEKGVFKRLLSRQRCVVLLNGFYEWAKEHKQKQPYYIYMDGHRDVTKMAGLFDCWAGAEGGPLYTFTIMTTDSSKRFSWLHDRMPVILHDAEHEKRWLSSGDIDPKAYAEICEPFNGEQLKWHPVTTAMSNMRYQGGDCAKEVKKSNISIFFTKPKAVSKAPVDKASPPKLEPAAESAEDIKSEPAKTEPDDHHVAPEHHDSTDDSQPHHAATTNKSQPQGNDDKLSGAEVKHEDTTSASRPDINPERPAKRGASQPSASPSKKQKQLPRGQGQISAFFAPNSK